MKITHVDICIPPAVPGVTSRLLAYANVVLDECLVVKGMKVIDGTAGRFIQMPSVVGRTICPSCNRSVEFLATYCPACGQLVPEGRKAAPGQKLWRDVVHPIRTGLREELHAAIIGAYEAELGRVAGREAS